jgi:hypothetical protein
VIVSPALSLMLVLGSVLVPPEGRSVVAVEENGRAVAACTDPDTWFVYDPELTHDGLWSKTSYEPPELASFKAQSIEGPWVHSSHLNQRGH